MKSYPCGCALATHAPTGARYSIGKCARHRALMRDPATLDEAYYAELGVIRDGRLAETRHVAEMAEALGDFEGPIEHDAQVALEVGCGVSPYTGRLRDAGWVYAGVEVSPWAADWMRRNHSALIVRSSWEAFDAAKKPFGLILAAHVLEHLPDAPAGLVKMADMLEPGGVLYLLVPDDSDPLNPDHLWFFAPESLRRCVELAGLTIEALEARQIVPRERFLYCRARKPG